MRRAWRWPLFATTLALAGCGRGCSTPPPPPPSAPPAPLPAAATTTRAPPTSLVDRVERGLDIELVERLKDNVLPGLATYPHRILKRFPVDGHLIARLDSRGLLLLGEAVDPQEADDDDELRARLRLAAQAWGERSGTAATRLYLAFDRRVDPVAAARLRRLAMGSHNWRVVGLAREGDQLLELLLGPAPAIRPTP